MENNDHQIIQKNSSLTYFLNTILRLSDKVYTQNELNLLISKIANSDKIKDTLFNTDFIDCIDLANEVLELYGLRLTKGIIQYPEIYKQNNNNIDFNNNSLIWCLVFFKI